MSNPPHIDDKHSKRTSESGYAFHDDMYEYYDTMCPVCKDNDTTVKISLMIMGEQNRDYNGYVKATCYTCGWEYYLSVSKSKECEMKNYGWYYYVMLWKNIANKLKKDPYQFNSELFMWEKLGQPGKPVCPNCTGGNIMTSGVLDNKDNMYYECLDCYYEKKHDELFIPQLYVIESLSRSCE